MSRGWFRTQAPVEPIWIPTTGLTEADLQRLGTYNAERARGLVHTDEWQAAMADLQARFNAGVGG